MIQRVRIKFLFMVHLAYTKGNENNIKHGSTGGVMSVRDSFFIKMLKNKAGTSTKGVHWCTGRIKAVVVQRTKNDEDEDSGNDDIVAVLNNVTVEYCINLATRE